MDLGKTLWKKIAVDPKTKDTLTIEKRIQGWFPQYNKLWLHEGEKRFGCCDNYPYNAACITVKMFAQMIIRNNINMRKYDNQRLVFYFCRRLRLKRDPPEKIE